MGCVRLPVHPRPFFVVGLQARSTREAQEERCELQKAVSRHLPGVPKDRGCRGDPSFWSRVFEGMGKAQVVVRKQAQIVSLGHCRGDILDICDVERRIAKGNACNKCRSNNRKHLGLHVIFSC